MRLQQHLSGFILVFVSAMFLVIGPVSGAEAKYSVGFKSDIIEITSPTESGFGTDGVLNVEGNSSLNRVWLALRGPNGETETIPVDVRGGKFTAETQLRFGAGKYTVWAGDNGRKFSGKIRFEVVDHSGADVRYLAPSSYVDSDNADISALARSLTGGPADDAAKAAAVHSWVTANISYDYAAYPRGDEQEIRKASAVLHSRAGICRDYAMLTAALARAAGIPARVVYGQATAEGGVEEYHAWNEFLIDGRWQSLDTCWDAGYIQDGSFVRAASDRFCMPAAMVFCNTHRVAKNTVH